jgi:hypothetical protein
VTSRRTNTLLEEKEHYNRYQTKDGTEVARHCHGINVEGAKQVEIDVGKCSSDGYINTNIVSVRLKTKKPNPKT